MRVLGNVYRRIFTYRNAYGFLKWILMPVGVIMTVRYALDGDITYAVGAFIATVITLVMVVRRRGL